MTKGIKKVWYDITQNTQTGEYSLKRLQNVLATFFAVLLTVPYVIELHVYPVTSFNLKEPPIEVLITWLSVALGLGALTITGKYFARKTTDPNGNPLEPQTNCEPPKPEPPNNTANE